MNSIWMGPQAKSNIDRKEDIVDSPANAQKKLKNILELETLLDNTVVFQYFS